MSEKNVPLWPAMLAGAGSATVVLVVYAMLTSSNHDNAQIESVVSNASTIGQNTNLEFDMADNNRKRLSLIEQQLASLTNSQILNKSAETEEIENREYNEDTVEISNSMPLDMTPEEAKAHELQAWENKKTVFRQESVDTRWAYSAGDQFQSDIIDLANQKGFSLINSECRTTQCAVVVEWPSFSEAVAGFTSMLHHDYQLNCGRETLLPDPSDKNGPYQVTMLFDCTELRKSG